MNIKLNDVLELDKDVIAVVYSIEETLSQIKYELYKKRLDNGWTGPTTIGYDKVKNCWLEKHGTFLGGASWSKGKKPKLSTKTLTIPQNWYINLFENEEADRE